MSRPTVVSPLIRDHTRRTRSPVQCPSAFLIVHRSRPRRDEIHEPPRRARPVGGQRHEVELPPDDRKREDHDSEARGKRSDAKDDAAELTLPERPRLHCEGAAHEAKRPGADERACAASNERPGVAGYHREGEAPGERSPDAVGNDRALN